MSYPAFDTFAAIHYRRLPLNQQRRAQKVMPPKIVEKPAADIKAAAAAMEQLYARVKPGRYNSLAITSLEQSVMWIVKELTS